MTLTCSRLEMAVPERRRRIVRHLQALYPPGTPGELVAYVQKPFLRVFGRPDDLESFADRILELDQAGCDTYLTINTLDGAAAAPRGPRARGREAEVAAVVAIVADIDAAPKAGHDYPTRLEIDQALLDMPHYPSLVVVSGLTNGGLHVYWLLDKPYPIRDRADRHRVKNISLPAGIAPQQARGPRHGQHVRSRARSAADWMHQPEVWNRRGGGSRVGPGDEGPRGSGLGDKSRRAALRPRQHRRNRGRVAAPSAAARFGPAPDRRGRRAPSRGSRPRRALARSRAPAVASSHGGGGGDTHTYNTAVCLVHGFGLSVDAAMPLLSRWNRRCVPPWRRSALRRKLQCADAWEGNRHRGWLCRAPKPQMDPSDDPHAANGTIRTKLVPCPTPKILKMRALHTQEPIRIATPCRNRRRCEACRSNWVVRNYRAIDRALTEALSPGHDSHDTPGQSPAIYTGEVDAAGLRAACKYLERGKRARGTSPHYVAILRPGGTRLLISFAPYAPRCRARPTFRGCAMTSTRPSRMSR